MKEPQTEVLTLAHNTAFTQLTARVGWLLYAFSALSVILGGDALLSSYQLGQLSPGTEATTDASVLALAQQMDAVLNTEWQSWLGLISLGLNLACVVLVLRWLYVAKQRALALGAHDTRFGPWATILWFFVPFAQLVLPYWAVRELWRCSSSSTNWQQEPLPRALPVWWLCWILANFAAATGWFNLLPLQTVAFAQIDGSKLDPNLTPAMLLSDSQSGLLALGLGHLLTLGASLALLGFIQKISKMQRRRWPTVVA